MQANMLVPHHEAHLAPHSPNFNAVFGPILIDLGLVQPRRG